MARLLLLLAFLFTTAALCSPDASAAEDPLIEQVVGDGADDELELNAEAHFASFVQRFGKTYRDDEERAHRLSVFKANLLRARRHQRLDPTAVHGVTKFSDLTPAEFRRQFVGLRRSRSSGRDLLKGSGSAHEAPILPTDGLPTDFDWREHGAVGPVKDQVLCRPVLDSSFATISIQSHNRVPSSWFRSMGNGQSLSICFDLEWISLFAGFLRVVLVVQHIGGAGGGALPRHRQARGAQRAADGRL
jgi:hypothetical protein